jgi:hypothetical protein
MTLIDADKQFVEQEETEDTEMETLRSAFPGRNQPREARPAQTGPGHWLRDGKRQNAHKHGDPLHPCTDGRLEKLKEGAPPDKTWTMQVRLFQ